MKKIIISMAAASLVATSAMAADKGIDFTTNGQAVVYYQTGGAVKSDKLFDQSASKANFGVQLDNVADLKNGFTLGTQITYLGTVGLEKNLVGNTMQTSSVDKKGNLIPNGGIDALNKTNNQVMLTKVYLAKKIANTTVKLGRQELPKALSPLAFSEGWNVFKNTFDAALVVNTDIPNTTIVGAYVGRSTSHDLSTVGDAQVVTTAATVNENGPAYMLTVQNKSLPMTTVTGSFYGLNNIAGDLTGTTAKAGLDATAVWLDVKVADKSLPMGLKAAVQLGSIMPDSKLNNITKVPGVTSLGFESTVAVGAKVGVEPMKGLKVCLAGSYVSGEDDMNKQIVAIKNVGTGVKTPLYTQLVANQNAIALDNGTAMVKGAYSLGDLGTVVAQGSYTKAGSRSLVGQDSTDMELLYQTKAAGMDLLVAGVLVKPENGTSTKIARVVARYKF